MLQLRQRSSWPSSLLTGLIGWIGWIFIGPLIFGITITPGIQLLIAIPSALLQVAVLRLLFRPLQMQRGIFMGILWGSVTALTLYYLATLLFPGLRAQSFYWMLIYLYTGAPVGGFLSYFYRDDHKIHQEQRGETNINYGRDAHWLEPFGFGVLSYLLVFLPFQDIQLTINVIITGTVSGIAAAGASHFSPDKWKRSYLLLALLIVTIGATQGFLTGLLFRNYDTNLVGNYPLKGVIAGVLTYLVTFLRGRQLAYKEENGLL